MIAVSAWPTASWSLARETPALFLLRVHQAGGQPLQIQTVLMLRALPPADLAFEPPHVPRRDERREEGRQQRNRRQPGGPPLRVLEELRRLLLVVRNRRALERGERIHQLEDRLARRHHAAGDQLRGRRDRALLEGEDDLSGLPVRLELRLQLRPLLALLRRVHQRLVVRNDGVDLAAQLREFERVMLQHVGRRADQRVAQVNRSQQHAGRDGGENLLAVEERLVQRRPAALGLANTHDQLVPGCQPERKDHGEPRDQGATDRRRGGGRTGRHHQLLVHFTVPCGRAAIPS